MRNNTFRLSFRTKDALHRKGDVFLTPAGTPVKVGQTPECDVRLISHPEWEDTCYAVLLTDGGAGRIIRQDQNADITLNGLPLDMAAPLEDGDRICFDRTEVEFRLVAQPAPPGPAYLPSRRVSPLHLGLLSFLILVVAGIIGYLIDQKKGIPRTFRPEMESIYAIRTDSLIVERDGVRVDAMAVRPAFVGSGFLTSDGYFVTARHCLEFWLAEENTLQADTGKIQSASVRWAIRAELDPGLTLRSVVTVTGPDGDTAGTFSSSDFLMDKSRDALYDRGNHSIAYLWRSLISRYSYQGAELGDVAVMRWDKKGTIDRQIRKDPEPGSDLIIFGYPVTEHPSSSPLQFFRTPMNPPDTGQRLYVEKEADPGYSGGPAFSRGPGGKKQVVGIVSRSSGRRTLLIPVSQIDSLLILNPDPNEND